MEQNVCVINYETVIGISFGSDQVLVLGPSLYSGNKESFKEIYFILTMYQIVATQ